mmetsp:Transcript_89183/g.154553  ORF Transcript_89183/g.154553 Transcript_89183/m.154553 type:complete len:285 (-) Transcript_89183:375-1229(-)
MMASRSCTCLRWRSKLETACCRVANCLGGGPPGRDRWGWYTCMSTSSTFFIFSCRVRTWSCRLSISGSGSCMHDVTDLISLYSSKPKVERRCRCRSRFASRSRSLCCSFLSRLCCFRRINSTLHAWKSAIWLRNCSNSMHATAALLSTSPMRPHIDTRVPFSSSCCLSSMAPFSRRPMSRLSRRFFFKTSRSSSYKAIVDCIFITIALNFSCSTHQFASSCPCRCIIASTFRLVCSSIAHTFFISIRSVCAIFSVSSDISNIDDLVSLQNVSALLKRAVIFIST